jgi:eukaryotic-like serine/threonine-protein kinase
MDADTWARLNRLLDEALDLPETERSRWLDKLPAEDEALKPRLTRLLAHATADDGFLDRLPELDPVEDDDSSAGGEGTVGPYRLLRELGEGGMGTVWLAERSDSLIKRAVALKLPRGPWMRGSTSERLARERDILAGLNHPNIARLYDAGQTAAGQPYLALEYVEGRRLDEYAADGALDLRSRLRLFLQVTRAVAHAHANLIIHRDLKPSNILVTAAGEVKLLDFGIAKLLEGDTAHASALTELAGRALTPGYASPEQIRGDPLTVASDVYSLGVVLYELLTGASPYKPVRDSRGGLEDAIVDADPTRPSQAAGSPPLRKALRGDLDVIVLKALRKRPDERYATVNALAEDVERFLAGQPVMAQPDRLQYRVAKFVARHRLTVGAAASVLLAVLAGAGLAVWQARVALAEKERAEEVKEFIASIFQEADPYRGPARSLSAVDLLMQAQARIDQNLAGRPELRIELLTLVGSSLVSLQQNVLADQLLGPLVDEARHTLGEAHPQTIRARVLLASVHRFLGRTDRMRGEVESLLPLLRASPAARPADLIAVLKDHAHLAIDEGRGRDAVRAAREACELATARLGESHPETVKASILLALAHHFAREPGPALETAERAYHLAMAAYHDRPAHPTVIDARSVYGRTLAEAGQLAAAMEQVEHAIRDATEVFGPSSMMVGFFSQHLARFAQQHGDLEKALANGQKTADILTQHAEPGSFTYLSARRARAYSLLAARRLPDALAELDVVADGMLRAFGPAHERTYLVQENRGLALGLAGHLAQAEREIEAALVPHREAGAPSLSRPLYALGVVRRLSGRHQDALRLQGEALGAMGDDRATGLERAHALTEVGLNHLELQEYQPAAAALEDALARFRSLQMHVTPEQADALVGLARVRLTEGRSAEAVALLERADGFWQRFDPANRWAGETAWWLGQAYASLRRSADARAARARATSILSGVPRPTSGGPSHARPR